MVADTGVDGESRGIVAVLGSRLVSFLGALYRSPPSKRTKPGLDCRSYGVIEADLDMVVLEVSFGYEVLAGEVCKDGGSAEESGSNGEKFEHGYSVGDSSRPQKTR